jgi:hypothetical protein
MHGRLSARRRHSSRPRRLAMVAAYTGELSSFQAFCARCGRGSPEVTALYRDLLRAFQRASPGTTPERSAPPLLPYLPAPPRNVPALLGQIVASEVVGLTSPGPTSTPRWQPCDLPLTVPPMRSGPSGGPFLTRKRRPHVLAPC